MPAGTNDVPRGGGGSGLGLTTVHSKVFLPLLQTGLQLATAVSVPCYMTIYFLIVCVFMAEIIELSARLRAPGPYTQTTITTSTHTHPTSRPYTDTTCCKSLSRLTYLHPLVYKRLLFLTDSDVIKAFVLYESDGDSDEVMNFCAASFVIFAQS